MCPSLVVFYLPTPTSVLQDVISTMFNSKFVDELFKAQEIYSNASTRQIFDRLAHSSIMRLNESSMDKVGYVLKQKKGI